MCFIRWQSNFTLNFAIFFILKFFMQQEASNLKHPLYFVFYRMWLCHCYQLFQLQMPTVLQNILKLLIAHENSFMSKINVLIFLYFLLDNFALKQNYFLKNFLLFSLRGSQLFYLRSFKTGGQTCEQIVPQAHSEITSTKVSTVGLNNNSILYTCKTKTITSG